MAAAFIATGGIGDVLYAANAATLYESNCGKKAHIFVNSHEEIFDFMQKCTPFAIHQCPPRNQLLPDPENPLNLPLDFIDGLFVNFNHVYSCFPDALGYAPFSFPWHHYHKDYKRFLQVRTHILTSGLEHPAINKNTKNIFINPVAINSEKTWPLQNLQKLIARLNETNYNVIVARVSNWKGAAIPFFSMGKFYDLVDQPIEDVVNVLNQCDYFFGVDSGLSHIAYHLGIPRIVLHKHYNAPFHQVRWHENPSEDLPLEIDSDAIFDRIVLNLREPLTTAIPAYLRVPANVNVKQLLIKKYYA